MKFPPQVTIWGFDLSELSFSAFSTKAMMDRKWHLRRERFIAYQLAMLICLAAECTATYSLSKYEDLQDHVEGRYPGAHLYNNDIIDMEITTIVFCVFVATLFGADFFFLLQFPKRKYPDWYQNTKKVFAIIITTGVFAACLGSTIVIANNSAKIEHVSQEVARQAAAYYYRPPLQYNKWAVNIAYVVVLWIGWVACVVSTVFMFMAASYDKMHGTDPITFRQHNGSAASIQAAMAPHDQASGLEGGHGFAQTASSSPTQRNSSIGGGFDVDDRLPEAKLETPNSSQVPLRSLAADGQHSAV